jgi:YidC/Oxa1 family membrane protein insertase
MSNQNKDTRSNLIFIVVLLLGFVVYYWAGKHFWPDKPPVPGNDSTSVRLDKEQEKGVRAAIAAVGGLDGLPWTALGPVAAVEGRPGQERAAAKPKKPAEKPVAEAPVDPEQLKVVELGDPGSHLTVKLNPHGAGVLQIVLNRFQGADPKTGEPLWIDGDPKKGKQPLELIPEDKNTDIASFLLYHFGDAKGEDFPLDTLGRRVWKRVLPEQVGDDPVQKAVFETEVEGVRITKTYTLEPRWYHVGLEVKLELVDPLAKEKFFRYQLQGPHGVPIEGHWYTGTYLNALIGRVDAKGNVDRDFQAVQTIALKEGGDEVVSGDQSIRYAVIVNQFFASGIAVATRDQEDRDFLAQARPLLLEAALRGTVRKPENDDEVVIEGQDRKRYTFEYANPQDRERFDGRLGTPGADVIVVHRSVIDRSGKSREVIVDVLDPTQTAPIFHNDITVEVSTPKDEKAIRLRPGAPVVHKYVLYNGPVKVGLLGDHLFGEKPPVDPADVDYYHDALHLNTLTDYHAPGWFSQNVLAPMQWTRVVIFFTNVMHWVLWKLYCVLQYVLPNILVYGVCILLLTVMVRGFMHPLSRKQARMTMKMQALQPELVKLKEKYKDDKQAMSLAQMELYRKHGINPMGSCWVMLLQMPVFLGLYYCLQESIHFRLAPFIPYWIKSLTAPDMMFRFPDWVPFINRWENYGAFYFLGPYFNALPVIAVVLMIFQQKYTMPPAADDQAAMQQKMMKYMMIFFGLMFYKVAAGLCLYFIASSLWGVAERKLLPKKKAGELPPPTATGRPTLMQRLMNRLMEAQRQQTGGNGAAPRPTAPPVPAGGGKKKRGRPAPVQQDGFMARVREWWAEVLRQAEKK